MLWLWIAITLVLLLDALRIRGRISTFERLDPAPSPSEVPPPFWAAPQVAVDLHQLRALGAHLAHHRLELLDVIPGSLPAPRALLVAQWFEPQRRLQHRFRAGRSVGHLVVASEAIMQRAGDQGPLGNGPAALVERIARLKPYAASATDFVLASQMSGRAWRLRDESAWVSQLLGAKAPLVLWTIQLAIGVLLALGLLLAPRWGLLALAAYHLQPLLVLARSPLTARGLVPYTLFRLPWDLYRMTAMLALRERPLAKEETAAANEARRRSYDELLAVHPRRSFEPRRSDCPICAGQDLTRFFTTRDLFQHKPGRFTLERCRACGHLFQNPRLNPEGLDFYYRDFYSGLGAEQMTTIFSLPIKRYYHQAQALVGRATPATWLDVGLGQGHFCQVARDIWPATRFDGLDQSENVAIARQRGWIGRGYQGLLPELAADLAGQYDVVSMHHYLEHTIDPRSEIRAAHRVLAAGGHLAIELPNPECHFARLLGRYWYPWLQPQHLHLLSVENLQGLLREAGFSTLSCELAVAAPFANFFGVWWLLLGQIAPQPGLPWRKPPSMVGLFWHKMIWGLGLGPLALGAVIDLLLSPLTRRPRWSSSYHVVACKD